MEGRKIAKSLSIYKKKYQKILEAKREEDPKKNFLQGFPDGKYVQLPLLNDYTGTKLKEELTTYQTMSKLNVMQLCTAVHGGVADNPKGKLFRILVIISQIINEGAGNPIEKWDILFRHLKQVKDESLNDIDDCDCMEQSYIENDPSASQTAFITTVLECAEKIYSHAMLMTKILLERGDIPSLYPVFGSVILTRNKLLFYSKHFRHENESPFLKFYHEFFEMTNALMKKIADYHTCLVQTVILHEGESNDWDNPSPFFDGERISFDIQFWSYYFQGLRADLYNSLSPSIAQSILQQIFNDSLGILAVRYSRIVPSSNRLLQYRGDILVIVLVAHDFLLSLVTNFYHIFCPLPKHEISRSIHAKCSAFMTTISVIGSSIKSIGDSIEENGNQQVNKLEPGHEKVQFNEEKDLIAWLHLTMTSVYSPLNTDHQGFVEPLSTSSIISILCRQAALQPQPEWGLIVRLILSRDLAFPILIMENFGAFVPEDFFSAGDIPSMKGGCGYLMCNKRCLGTADYYWPQVVGSGVLYVVMHGNPENTSLVTTLRRLLSKLSAKSWDFLSSNLMWNVRRPVWFQALVELLEPYLCPLVDDLLEDVESGKTWTLSHVEEAMKKMHAGILDVIYLIPPSFYQNQSLKAIWIVFLQRSKSLVVMEVFLVRRILAFDNLNKSSVCKLIESLLPENISPLCGSIVIHLFFSSIYGIINKLLPVFRQWRMQREKLNFLIAFGEKLCHLEHSSELQKLSSMVDASSQISSGKNHAWDNPNEEYIQILSETVANTLLEEPEGQEALKSIYRFICYNSDWVQTAIGVDSRDSNLESETPIKLKPWKFPVFEEVPPSKTIGTIGNVKYKSVMGVDFPTGEMLKFANKNHLMTICLLEQRRRRRQGERGSVDDDDDDVYEKIFTHFKNHLNENMELFPFNS